MSEDASRAAAAETAIRRLAGRPGTLAEAGLAAQTLRWAWAGVEPAPPAPGAPGQLVLRRQFRDQADWDGTVVVEAADPVIWVSAALLTLAAQQQTVPQLRLEPWRRGGGEPDADLRALACSGVLTGEALLKVDAEDRMLVYRVGQYRPAEDCYECSWPD